MTLNENIKFVVRQCVKKVLNDKFDRKIFEELELLNEYLEDINQKDLVKSLATFKMLSCSEMKNAIMLLSRTLINELYRNDISFLQIMRIITALSFIDYEVTSLQYISTKVEFCIKIWQENIYQDLETIALLDKI